MRTLLLVVTFALISGGVSSCATYTYRNGWIFPLAPPLVWVHGCEFADRIARRFPPGSPEDALTRELKFQGFRIEWTRRGSPDSIASYSDVSILTHDRFVVSWRAAADGRLETIKGRHERAVKIDTFTDMCRREPA